MPFDGTHLTDVQRVLIQARSLAENGWCKGDMQKVDGAGNVRYCIAGAIHHVAFLETRSRSAAHSLYRRAMNVMRSVLRKNGVGGGYAVEAYNDASWRRKPHVLATFDRAIVRAAREP